VSNFEIRTTFHNVPVLMIVLVFFLSNYILTSNIFKDAVSPRKSASQIFATCSTRSEGNPPLVQYVAHSVTKKAILMSVGSKGLVAMSLTLKKTFHIC